MLKTNTYIMSIDGSKIVKQKCDFKKEKGTGRLYTCTLPYNMDLIELDEITEQEFRKYEINGIYRQFSDALINVTFDRKVKTDKGEIKTKAIREQLYKDGFCVNGEKYVLYKRSSSKAREGSVLFIKEKLYKPMMDWSHMRMEFKADEKLDIASLKAYESLTLSGIEDVITIKPNQILIIDDVYGTFKTKASVTRLVDKKVVTQNEEIELSNNIWDGQCLLDETVFNKVKRKDKGMMLLRNKFFKGCAFNTRIKYFFDNRRVKEVTDMFGRTHQAKDIKLIITPSCLKLFKFAYKFDSEEQMYEHWRNNISNFGIVKSEKASYFDDRNQLSYQMLNSMPLEEKEVHELAKDEIDYVNDLKNNMEVFKKHIEINDQSVTRQMMFDLLEVNEKFQYTEMFNEFRKDVVESYMSKLRRGKIKVRNTDYCVIVSNPFEMLLATIGKFEGKTIHQAKEIYTSMFEDGDKLCCFRNPHIAQANILYATNVYSKQFSRYFNFTKNIVIVNSYDNDLPDRLQGCDYDSDTQLISNNPILVEKARLSKDIPTPVNAIKFKVTTREYTNLNMAIVDRAIANAQIGRIVNLSQLFNSCYWQEYATKGREGVLNVIRDKVSQLSSLSQLEIDKAKKYFSNEELNTNSILDKLSKDTIIPKNAEGKVLKPKFFKYISSAKYLKSYKCPMDYLQTVLGNNIQRKISVQVIDIQDCIEIPNDYKSSKANKKQIKELKDIANKLHKDVNSIRYKEKEKQKIKKNIFIQKEYVFNKIGKKKVNVYTIINLIKRMYSENSKDSTIREYRLLILQALYKSNKNGYIKLFKSNKKCLEN